MFSAVLSVIDEEQLSLLVNAILHRIEPHYPATRTKPIVGDPIYGSYHVLFPLIFDDDLRCVAKIQIKGTVDRCDEISASAFDSEANAMRLLKRETTIPLVAVQVNLY